MKETTKVKIVPKNAGSKLRERLKKRREKSVSTDALFEILKAPTKIDQKKSATPRNDKDLDV